MEEGRRVEKITVGTGIDVSTHNGAVDWEKVKKAGVQFAIVRAGFGNTASQQDARFESHMKGAMSAGLPVGVYWFQYARSEEEAREEAKACLQVIGPYKEGITLPVFSDYEYDSDEYAQKNGITPTRAFRTSCIRAFCEEIEKAGYTPGVYTNPDFVKNRLNWEDLKEYDLWLAAYTQEKPDYDCAIWQYTSEGTVDGVTGNVDRNLCYKEYGGRTDAGVPDVTYRVRGQAGKWYPAVKNLTDYAGKAGDAVTDVAVKVSAGSVRYRVHLLSGRWLPWVTGYDTGDRVNGYAGNGTPIDALQIQYTAPGGKKLSVKYRVSPLNGNYYPYQVGTAKTGGMDGYAGVRGKKLDRLQIVLE